MRRAVACIVLLAALVAAPTQAGAPPRLQADSMALDGAFQMVGDAAYFLDFPRGTDGPGVAMAVDAASIHYELDTAANSVNVSNLVVTQGQESTHDWTRTVAHLETETGGPDSQLALLPLGPATVTSGLGCARLTSGTTTTTLPVYANTKRAPLALPSAPLLTFRGCSQTFLLHGTFRLVAWGWTLAGRDGAGVRDDIATGTAHTASSGSDPGVGVETRTQLYATLWNATVLLNLPDAPRWVLGVAAAELHGAGAMALTGASGSLLRDGKAIDVGAAAAAWRLQSSSLTLAPEGSRVGAAVVDQPRTDAVAAAIAGHSGLWLALNAAGFLLLVVFAAALWRSRQARRAAQAGLGRTVTVPIHPQLEAAKNQFAALFAELPE